MTVMGETTGSLDTSLENVANYYNQVIPRRIKKIFTIVEPMLMLLLIGIVGAVALADLPAPVGLDGQHSMKFPRTKPFIH
jgi:type II secretory pathway component PulF